MTRITITGRATADPELRFTPAGVPVANFTLAENRRKFDKQKGEHVDDGTSFYRVQAWRHLAEACADKIRKGAVVIVVGELAERQFEDRDGNKRSSWEVTADEVGLALPKFAPKGDGGNFQRPAPAADPWATAGNDEPPF